MYNRFYHRIAIFSMFMLKYIMQNMKKCGNISVIQYRRYVMAFIISGFSDEIDEKIDVQFEAITRLGISYFEPRGIDGKNISTLTSDEVKALREKMDKFNIKASSIGSHIGKF